MPRLEAPAEWRVSGTAALFDMDGTLVDSTAVVETLWTEFAKREGLDPEEVIRFAHGRQTRDTLARFLPHVSVDRAALAMLREELSRRNGIRPISGATAFLADVSRHVPVAVVTSASRELALVRLNAARIPVPHVLVAGEDVAHGKPAPDGYLLAAHRLGVDIATALAFEDAEAGLRSATAAGARVVVVGALNSPTAASLPRLLTFDDAEVLSDRDRVLIQHRPS